MKKINRRVSDEQIKTALDFYGFGCKEGAVYADLRDCRAELAELKRRIYAIDGSDDMDDVSRWVCELVSELRKLANE